MGWDDKHIAMDLAQKRRAQSSDRKSNALELEYKKGVSDCRIHTISEILEEHIAEYQGWQENWETHRQHTEDAMQRITLIEPAIKAIAENIGHLSCLPDIKQHIKDLRIGLSDQNKRLILQQERLIEPAHKAQTLLSRLLILVIFLIGMTTTVLLLKETEHGFKLGPFEMTPRMDGHGQTK